MPSPERIAAQRARRRRRRLGIGAAAAVAVVAVGGGAAVAMGTGSGPSYRLATVTAAGVSQTLSSVGTLTPVNQAVASFPVAGTVAVVAVHVGDQVTGGQLLATLDTTALRQQITSDTAAVANAQQTLAADEASQTASAESTATAGTSGIGSDAAAGSSSAVSSGSARASAGSGGGVSGGGVSGGSGGSVSAAPSGSHSSGSYSSGATKLVAAVTRDQRNLLAAQQALDHDLTSAEQALHTCRDDLSAANTSSPTPSPTSPVPTSSVPTTAALTSSAPTSSVPTTAAPTSSAPATTAAPAVPAAGHSPSRGPSSAAPSPTGSPSGSGDAAAAIHDCLAAIDGAPDQSRTGHDSAALAKAERSLGTAIAALIKASATSGSTTAGSGRSSSTSGGSTSNGNTATRSGTSSTGTSSTGTSSTGTAGTSQGSRTGGTTNRSSGPATPQQLAADQAAIDAATANLALGNQNLGASTLTSPISGTVAAVGLAVGSSSGSSTITVVGPGQTEVATSVPLSAIDSVKVGQRASVTVDGLSAPLTGRVTAVGLLSSTTGSTTTYPVTVLLDPTAQHLVDGAGAAVTIDVASASNVLTVPSSAVHVLRSTGTVTVFANGKTRLVRVTVGAVGVDRTQILSGLTAGQQVVLADLATPLPTAITNPNVARRLGAGGGAGGALTSGGGLGGGTTGRTGRGG